MGITDMARSAAGAAFGAARNTWSLFAGDGIAPPHRTPSVVVGDGPHRTLRRSARRMPGPRSCSSPRSLRRRAATT